MNLQLFRMLIISVVVISPVRHACDKYSGDWEWNEAPESRTFSVDLKCVQGTIVDQYCAVAQSGARIDCSDQGERNLFGSPEPQGDSAMVRFFSFFGAMGGKAVISNKNNRLVWQVIKEPIGEHYAPKAAELRRRQ